jgi:4-hydroxy-tetrahydrodipicolinate synthase
MHNLNGITSALVTPLDESGNILEDGLRQMIDYSIEGGIHGIYILGSTGEIYGLDDNQKRQMVEITVDHTNGRVPIYAGVSEITTRDCLKTIELIEKTGGISAVSVLTPYFIKPSQEELFKHYNQVAQSTHLPILLHSNEGRTNVSIHPDTCVELSKVQNIIGIQDSCGNMIRMAEYIRRTIGREFYVLSGKDALIFSNLCYGGAGAIANTGSIAPGIVTGIYRAFVDGDWERARELQYNLSLLKSAFSLASFPVVVKEALKLLGINAGDTLSPINEMTAKNRGKLIHILKELNLYQVNFRYTYL